MDVVLHRKPLGLSDFFDLSAAELETAELLMASEFTELVAELRQLKQRNVTMVSVRRQRAMRIGPALLKDVLEDFGVRVCTVGFAGGFTGLLNRSYRQAVDDTRRALEFAAELKARAVAVLPGSRGLHTYNHATRIVRSGMEDCVDDAHRYRVDMLLPLNSFLGKNRDVFTPRGVKMLDWVDSFQTPRIRSMMLVRGRRPLAGLPDSWERCLRRGGMLRMTGSIGTPSGSREIIRYMARKLNTGQSSIR